MLAIYKPKWPSIRYNLFSDKYGFQFKSIELRHGYEFCAFQRSDISVMKCYVNKDEFVNMSIYDLCWVGKHPIPRDIIPERIPIFTNS